MGESELLFVKVLAPATLPMGSANVSTVKATWDAGLSTTSAMDVTTTNSSEVSIRKEQALDVTCNGLPDFAYSYADFDAEPGQCVLYRLTATNTGAEAVMNVRIQDATPAFTAFITAGGLPKLSQGALESPVANGGRGSVVGLMGTVPAGDQATLTFGIKIQ